MPYHVELMLAVPIWLALSYALCHAYRQHREAAR